MNRFLKLMAVFLFVGVFNSAHAKIPVYFGESDYLEKIEGAPEISEGGTKFALGHRVYIKWLIAGLYLKDEGYILLAEKNQYIPLSAEMIEMLQESGLLPEELPKYSISPDFYLKGYSLWIILILIVGYVIISARGKKDEETMPKDQEEVDEKP